jgi:uncharacterized protein (TIGR02147 family)
MNDSQLFFDDYRRYLREAFDLRSSRNKSYSLRAFARDLELAVSTLTELLNGKYGLSPERAIRVAKNLNLNDLQSQHFSNLVAMKYSRKTEDRETARIAVEERLATPSQELSTDQFKTVSGWHHMALLELAETKNFISDPEWMAKRLGLSLVEIQESLSRMERLGLIVWEAGQLKPTGAFTTVGNGRTSDALREVHGQLISKAAKALGAHDMEKRDVSSTIFSIDTEDLPAAKEELMKFRRQFAMKYSKGKSADGVYCLGIQLFSLLESE